MQPSVLLTSSLLQLFLLPLWKKNNKMLVFNTFHCKITQIPYCLLSLCLSYFWLLISFLQNALQSGALDSSVEFYVSSSCSLFGSLFLCTFLMLSSVQYSPSCITRVALHEVRLLRFSIGEVENLSLCIISVWLLLPTKSIRLQYTLHSYLL